MCVKWQMQISNLTDHDIISPWMWGVDGEHMSGLNQHVSSFNPHLEGETELTAVVMGGWGSFIAHWTVNQRSCCAEQNLQVTQPRFTFYY